MSDVLTRLTDSLHSKYRVEREIGAGGMATVYLAHDVRHDRDVAIKVLHPDLAAALGAERFLAEIKTTAKLQHPHILPLLDSGEADGLLYYVMPFVAGESLRSRLDRETQLSVDDAVRIAREVASAIESAHKQGVVHRDIKPENILLHEEQALVADFGIALAVSAAGGARMTQTGLSLGTPQYMAPEQAMGERVIDGRADIYALGAVTYEMLVGEAPFTGPSVQAIVARVMTESPRSITAQRKSVPENVNAAVLKALEKLPADRFTSAADFSKALVTSDYGALASPSRAAAQPEKTSSRARAIVPWAIAGVASLAAIVLALRVLSHPAQTPVHLAVDLPADVELIPGQSQGEVLGISQDGTMIAFGAVVAGKTELLIRRLDGDSLQVVKGSTGAQGSATFSPDGQWLAFGADRKLFKTPTSGGPATPLAEANWAQITWVGNGMLVYTKDYNTGLYRVGADGADSATLTTPDPKKGELGHWWPEVLPDGDHVLFTNYVTPADKSTLEVISLKSGKRQVVFRGGYFGRYINGYLLFTRGATVMEVPFDASGLKVTGTAVPLPIDIESRSSNGWAAFAVSRTGTLVYREDVLKNVEVVWSDENGSEEMALDSSARITSALASPDNRKIAVVRDGDVWTYDRQRGVYTRLTQTEQVEGSLAWTPDSKEIIYSRDVPQYDLFKRAVDGGSPEQLVATSRNDKHASSVTSDGKNVLYQEDQATGVDVFIASLDQSGTHAGRKLIDGNGNQYYATVSPDGRWLAYESTESGRREVYLVAYPLGRGPARQQVSILGGSLPVWSKDGRSIYYSFSNRIFRVRFNTQTSDIGKPEILTKIAPGLSWSIGPDGRFLISKIAKGGEHRSLKVILDWAPTLQDISRRTR